MPMGQTQPEAYSVNWVVLGHSCPVPVALPLLLSHCPGMAEGVRQRPRGPPAKNTYYLAL